MSGLNGVSSLLYSTAEQYNNAMPHFKFISFVPIKLMEIRTKFVGAALQY